MDFVETKFLYKNHVLELNLKTENMSKKWFKKPKNCRSINFEVFLVGKVPKSSIFTRESLENSVHLNYNQKWVK